MRNIATLCFGVAALAVSSPSSASDWIVTIGGRAQAVVPFEGAGHDIFVPTPALQIRRVGRPDRPVIADDGLGLSLLSLGPFSAGPVVRLRGKRGSDFDHAGLSEIPLAIEPGVFANLWATNWLRLHGEMRRGVRGHAGWIGDAGLDLALRSGPWTATLGPRVGWGDHSYMDTYFGVTPAEAAANPVLNAAYMPAGGIRYEGGAATLARRWGKQWQTTANFGFHRLASIPGDSPIIRSFGGRDEFSGGLGLKYSFTWSR